MFYIFHALKFHLSFTSHDLAMKRIALASILLLGACADGPTYDTLGIDIQSRSGFALPEHTIAGLIALPPYASLDDGLTEDEAVSIALWNNAVFQQNLVNLDVARGDLIQAGLLPNPSGSYTFQNAAKPFKYALEMPIEALWLRPFRVNAAKADAEKTSHELSQAGLTLIRDTRKAYTDLQQTHSQFKLLTESKDLRTRIASMAGKRYEAGEISKQESNVAALDAIAAEQAFTRAEYDIQADEERLRYTMGIGAHAVPLKLDTPPPPHCKTMDIDMLLKEGLTNRPDILASKEAITAAKERTKLSRFSWLGLTGVADATSGESGHEMSPGVKGAVPIFNRNQGTIERSSAEEERAIRAQESVEQQARLEINQAYIQYRQACGELNILQSKMTEGVKADLRRVEKAYASGDVPYLLVLETSRALIDTQMRETQLAADMRRALSELERSVGTKLPEATPPAPANDNVPGK